MSQIKKQAEKTVRKFEIFKIISFVVVIVKKDELTNKLKHSSSINEIA